MSPRPRFIHPQYKPPPHIVQPSFRQRVPTSYPPSRLSSTRVLQYPSQSSKKLVRTNVQLPFNANRSLPIMKNAKSKYGFPPNLNRPANKFKPPGPIQQADRSTSVKNTGFKHGQPTRRLNVPQAKKFAPLLEGEDMSRFQHFLNLRRNTLALILLKNS